MSEIDDESDDESYLDIASEALPISLEKLAVPIELDQLFPWHRPRKQYVRQHQWLALSRRLIEKIKGTNALHEQSDGKKEVRYLTLPGIDYFDVSLLAKACRDLGIALTSTGFVADLRDDRVKARAQMREEALIEQELITIRSHTFPRRLEDISSEKSLAYKDFRERGPFNIVNVDACGSMSLPSQENSLRLIDAVYRLVEYQLETSRGRWLLFVTTDVTPQSFSKNTLSEFKQAIIDNAAANADFDMKAKAIFEPEAVDIEAALESAEAGSNTDYLKLFSLGFSKWLLHLVESKQWNMKAHHSYYYSTTPSDNPEPSMPCLAYEFIPPVRGLRDAYDVVNVEPATGNDIGDMSIRTVEKISEMVDLDERMANNQTLCEEMKEATRALLVEAGYTDSAIASLD